MKTRLNYIYIFLMLACLLNCQNKFFNNWHFGTNAAISFNTNPPSFINNSVLISNESCAAISDSNGVLLFYSDGIKVYNKNNQQMPNGFGLNAHQSATQGAFIVPKPRSKLYYLFTMDAQDGAIGGGGCLCLSYSIVDMSLQSGLGDVISKNNFLYLHITEKMSAVQASDTSYWVVAHEWGSDKFLSYLITPSGLNTIPVISQAGSSHCCDISNANATGQMKISSDGKKIGYCLFTDNKIEIANFDISTGIVSNALSISPGFTNMYGFEFSTDSRFIYATNVFILSSHLLQFDISNWNANSIMGSMQDIYYNNSGTYNQIQLGPDGKIYVSENGEFYLSCINSPNSSGSSCNFTKHSLLLGNSNGSGTCYNGLPNMIIPKKMDEQEISIVIPEPYIPNVFTPNEDGVNDTWGIKFNFPEQVKNYAMRIYDRWGIMVYSTGVEGNLINSRWDGRTSSGVLCSAGVYFYFVNYSDPESDNKKLSGNINLIR